jgi:tRNA (guanosine-2'-O-)-methyltransferase
LATKKNTAHTRVGGTPYRAQHSRRIAGGKAVSTGAHQQLIDHLAGYVSPERITRMRQVLANRTRYVTLVLEDVYKARNASATLRTCDALGVQDVHIIEKTSPFSLERDVELGSARWLTLHRYRDAGAHTAAECYTALRAGGYRVIATSPNAAGATLDAIDLDRPLALVFGNEERGMSEYALRAADGTLRLPMYGFTRSFNISVSVAIALAGVIEKMRASGAAWELTAPERTELILEWMRKSIRRCDLIEQKFLKALQRGSAHCRQQSMRSAHKR